MIAYGPVPSRRLGRSLGINNIPPKTCSYSCVYCQLGRSGKIAAVPGTFYAPETVVQAVAGKIASNRKPESIDYLAFVPDGEPTLDGHLGETIDRLRSFTQIKIAVITNSSLIWRDDVRQNLKQADWVSLKIDTVREPVWRRINRPHRSLGLRKILDGIAAFAGMFNGTLVTETMLIRDINDGPDHIADLSDFIRGLPVHISYLSVPTRPPTQKNVQGPAEERLIQAYRIMRAENRNVECLTGYEGNAFAFTGNAENDLLSITAVHPMREEAVSEFLSRAEAGWPVVNRLIEKGLMVKKEFGGITFYARKL
ncbi:radical SAM protein [bacterium]|nr:radical SAM protein [bacterium]